MTKTHRSWEGLGWLNVHNADCWQQAIFLVCSRTAETTFEKVKAHLGVDGNERADTLAKQGAELDGEEEPLTVVPPQWQLNMARLASLTCSQTYQWIWASKPEPKGTSARLNLERIREVLSDFHNLRISDEQIWLSLRKPYVRREISDFLWMAIHRRTHKWGPGWEDKQFCSNCGVIESIEHILTQCDNALWRRRLWQEAQDLIARSHLIPNRLRIIPTFPEVLGTVLITAGNPAGTRLWTTIISETAFTIWKLKNRAHFDEIRIRQGMAVNVWRSALEARAKVDFTVARLKGATTAAQGKRASEAVTTWRSVCSYRDGAIFWDSADYG
ncbi:hypothetical protein M407DRAFT_79071 [Tulasnella calospora MUT 4182]|uniref:RNase H type-1 domain-containing protein n=1 Tax=Tulasnella calospora MUT 4182 TaxID=1051891 RepID=A0A0C3LMJ6_9AGAM|nr:hypothetical protein M407DRAFT_79071 [Tulasnella calospora MUT 4182]